MIQKTMHIGLDDTDSTRKGCTTYIAALIIEKLQKFNVEFIDYPNLVRLNPNVPWKTRGNGALCLRILFESGLEKGIKESVTRIVERNADLDFKGTDPGIVFFERKNIPLEFRHFAKNAITTIVNLRSAMTLITKFKAEAIGFKNGRGIIGALAAIGETLRGDHTYEVLAYRMAENCGKERRINEDSIFKMDEKTTPYTFNNIDLEKGRIIITPRGPDPILFGIRGETPEIVKKAFHMVKPLEPVERWVVFRTNQGTDAHLRRIEKLNEAKPYNPLIARGTVSTNPMMIRGKHVIFSIRDRSAEVDCAAYEPTGALRRAAKELIVNDQLEIYGSVRTFTADKPVTINLEKMRVLRLQSKKTYLNPVCPNCGKRLKSMGRDQGFRCEKCCQKYRSLVKVGCEVKRGLKRGLYITATRSQRHLTKPYIRYGMEKHRSLLPTLIDEWHFP